MKQQVYPHTLYRVQRLVTTDNSGSITMRPNASGRFDRPTVHMSERTIWKGSDLRRLCKKYPVGQAKDKLAVREWSGGSTSHYFECKQPGGTWEGCSDPRRSEAAQEHTTPESRWQRFLWCLEVWFKPSFRY